MRKFDDIKRSLYGDDTATLDPDYAQVPSDSKATSLTNRLLEAKARINQQKLQVAAEVFGNGHKNTAPVAEQKAYIKSPENTTELLQTQEQKSAETEKNLSLDPSGMELFDNQLKEDLAPEPTDVLFKDLNDAADRYGVPKNLLKALAKQESNFDNEAVSQTGVRGVLQVTERTGKEMFKGTGVEFDVTNQDHQIEAGTKYLAKHIKDWKAKGFDERQSQQLATMSYNTGFSRVSKAIKETGKQYPSMQEIEDAGIKLFSQKWDVKVDEDSGKKTATKDQSALRSFKEGAAHWKKIHYKDGELQDYRLEGGDEFVTAGTPASEPLALDVDDFEDEAITEQDRSTPGAIAKKVARNAQKPPKPINVDKEWDKLLDTVVANDDVFLMGLSDGTESLKIAAKAFMKSQGVSGLTSPQALTYLNENAEDLVNWIKKTSSTERAALEDTAEPVKIDVTPKEPTDISVPTTTKTPIKETTGELREVPDIQERDPSRVKDQLKPAKIIDRDVERIDPKDPVTQTKDVRIIEEEPIVDVGELSPDDIYSSALDYYEKSATTDLDAAYESTDGFDLAYLAQKEIQRQKDVTQGFMPLENKTAVVEQFSNRVFKHKDGTWTVRTSSGRELTGLDEIMAKSYADYDRENWASDPDAPLDGSAGQYFNQTMQSLAYPVELIASAFTQTPESRASIKKMAEEYKKYFPVNRASMQGASTALALIAEQKGSVEAIKYAFNNIGTFLEKGFDSVGFTLALAVGNVPVQIGMLASLSHGKANTMKDEWRQLDENKGKELTPEIAARIEISAAFSMLAEKVSVQAIKGVVSGKPLIKVDPTKWMNKVGDAINRGINKNLGTKTANLLLVKPITKIAAPLAGEGGQEVISQGFEHWGLKEEFLSKSEMVAIGIEGTLAAPGVGGTVAGLHLTKEVAKQVAKGTPATRKRIFLETTLGDTQAELSKLTIEDRIIDLDQQIADLSEEVTDTPTGVASQNKRFNEIYDTLRAEAFGQLSIPDAIKAAKEQLATELESLKSEKAQLEKDTKPFTFKDNEFLSRPIKRDLAQVEQQIEALKKAEPKQGESPTARNEQIQNLEARKKKLEDKLNSRVNKQQLEYLRQKLTQAKAKIEAALETDLGGKKKTKEELAGIALDPKYGKELGEGELAIALNEVGILAETEDPGLLDPDRKLDPIGLEATSDYTPTEDSGLEVVKETEGGAVTSNTVQLKEEPAEWTNKETGRRLTEKDFDSRIEYQQFVKKTRKFDADRERGIKELKRLKEEKIKEISPEDINPRRQQLVLEKLTALTNRKLNDKEKQAVREKVAELKEKGVLKSDRADQVIPETTVDDVVVGETSTFYLPDGSPIELEVIAVSESGTVKVRNEKGEEELVGERLWTKSAASSDYKMETIEGTPEVRSLTNEELDATIKRTEEKTEVHLKDRKAGKANAYLSILRELNALKLERKRRKDTKESEVDKLFSGPTAFADAQNATPEQLKKAIDDPNTDAATKKHLRAIEQAQKDQKELDKKLEEDKTFADVHEEVVRGEGKRFKGLHTYRNEIIELLKNPEKRPIALINQKVAVLYDEMQNHATNLSNKLYAFKQAYKKAESGFSDTGKLWAVSGIIDPDAQKLNPNTRKMKYTVQEMTRAEFDKEVEERREAAGISFLTEISSSKQTDTTLDSRNLINALEEEVKLGRSAWEAVKTYPTTSIAKNEAKAQDKAEADSEFLAGLDKIEEKIGRPTEEISDEQIADIKDPQKRAKVKEGDIVNVVDQDGSLITPKPVPITKMLGKGPDGIEYVQVEGSSAGYRIDRIVPVKSETKARPKGKSNVDKIAEIETKLKAAEAKLDALKEAKKNTLGSAPDDEQAKLEEEIAKLKEELAFAKSLEEQADQQPTEDTEGDGADEVFDETTKTSKPPTDSAKQPTQEAGTDAETETKTKAGKVQDFIASAIKKYWPVILKASAKNRERIMGMLGAFFTDLVQIGDIKNVPGLHTLQDTDFIWTDADIESGRIRKPQKLVGTFSWQKLRDALTGLGVDKATAKHIAQQYGKFKDRYENIAVALKAGSNVRIIDSEDTQIYKILSINSEGIAKLEGKDTAQPKSLPVEQLFDAKQFALGEPLSILLRPYNNSKTEQVGKLPDQILLGMYLGALAFRTKNPTNTRFTSDWQKKQFLYSGKDEPTSDEITELADVGHGFNESADSIGSDIAKSLQLSAKKIAKDHPTLTQASADLYYARLLPALGMMALDIAAGKDSEAWFSIENKRWDFKVPNKTNRNFNNPANEDDKVTYRHIKYPEDSKLDPADKEALTKLEEQLDMKLDSYGEVLREPVDTPTRIKRSLKKVPRKVRKALEKLHNAKWNVSETADSVVVLNKSDAGKDLLNRLMGILPTEGDMHQRQRDSYEAANRDKQNDLKSFLEANEAGELKDFYFAYELQGHHRILQQGKINPQNSKVTRFLLQSWGAQTYNKNNLWKFKLAVAQNFGLDVDKNKFAWAETQFDHIVNNGHVQEAVKAMQALNENKDDKAAASKLAEAVSQIKSIDEYKDANIQLLTAITALAKYMPSGDPIRAKAEFKSDIVMEIDGITNGFAMNLLQFPIFDYEQLETHLNQTGTWYDVRSSHDPTKPDVYMTLIDHIKEGDTDDKALDWYIENAWKSDFVSDAGRYTKGTKKKPPTPQQEAENARTLARYPEMYKARSEALRSLVPDLHLYNKKMRKTVKYPFMIYMYGGGTKSIAQGVASDVVDGFYEEVTALHNMWQAMQKGTVAPEDRKYLNELGIITREDYKNKMMAFVDNLEKLGAFEGKRDIEGNVNPRAAKKRYKEALLAGKALDTTKAGKAIYNFNDAELIQVIGRTVEPRFEHGLSSMLGSTKNARSDVIKMGQMMHRMFMLKYETAYQKKLDKINAEYKASLSEEDRRNFVPLDRLTEKQITEMVAGQNAELSEVIPQAAGPLAQILLDRETGKEYTDGALDLSSIEGVRDNDKTQDAKEPWDNEKIELTSDKISNKMTPSEKDNRPANRDIMEKQLRFVEPGVSALIRQIQNMDSVLLTQTFGGGNGKGDPRINVGFTNNKWEGDGNVLPLHDAFMASPEQLSVISEIYGKAYIEYNKKYSIIETTFKQVQKIRRTLTPDEANVLNQMYSAEEENKQNPRDADDFIDEFKDRTEEVQEFRKLLFEKMKEKGVVSHQLYMPKPQGESITNKQKRPTPTETNKITAFKSQLVAALRARQYNTALTDIDEALDPDDAVDPSLNQAWWIVDNSDLMNTLPAKNDEGMDPDSIINDPAIGDILIANLMDTLPAEQADKDNVNRVRDWKPKFTAQGTIDSSETTYQDNQYTTEEKIAAIKILQGTYVPAVYESPDQLKLGFGTPTNYEESLEEIDDAVNEKEPLPGAEVDRPVLPFNDENGDPVKVNDDQWRAMAQMETWWGTDIDDINNKIFVLQGRGGTGKTTIVEAALTKIGLNLKRNPDFIDGGSPLLENGKPISDPTLGEVKFALPTHKAKQVIKQAAGKYRDDDFTTIAGLLGEKPNYVSRSDKEGKITWTAQFKKDQRLAEKALDDLEGVKVIVIDEASMVNEKQTTELIQIAEELNIRLLFMGDNVQLPPIEQDGKGTVDVARVFDTAMGIGQKKPIPFEPKHYAQLKQRMRQDADNPILAITDILANVAEWIHNKHKSYKKLKYGKNTQLYFELPLINNKNVKYMDGDAFNGATKNTIKAFADDYRAAQKEDKEGGVKYIHYNAAAKDRSVSLRTKIRKAIFGDADPGVSEKPYLKDERIVLDDSITLLNKDGEVQSFTKDLHNGDEVTVQKELYTAGVSFKDGKDNPDTGYKAPVYEDISADILEVKLDGSDEVYELVLENAQSKKDIVKQMIRNKTYGTLKNKSGNEKLAATSPYPGIYYTGHDKFSEGRVLKEMFTEGLGAAYIINAHKSQGSTYDTVYADYESMLRGYHGADFLTRVKALYVATSRPRTKLVMVGDAGPMGLKLSFGDGDLNKENEELIAANQEILENVVNKETPNLDEDIEKDIQGSLGSMDDLPNEPTGDPRDLGVIGKGNFKKLFDQFKQFSTNYYANTREMLAHSETLDTVLGILGEGISDIGGINLSLQEVQGITQGEYDIANRAMKINLSNSVPYSVNQSPQEVYVHELLHATTALGIRQNPLIVNRVERVYVQTKRAIDAKYGAGSGYKVFLTDITNPTENDTAMAKKQYNYVFAGREKDRIHEFLAYAATNRQMIEFLKTQPKPVREGILDNIIGIITDIMNFLKESFGARTYAAKGNNAFAEILAATEHLVAVQAKHESMLDRLNAYTYNKLDQSDAFLKRTGEDVLLKLEGKKGETPSRLRQAVFGAAGGIYATMTTNEATIALRQKIDQKLNKTLRGIANEIGDGALTKEMIEQLLYVKVNISKARQQAETFTMSWFNGNKKEGIEGIWKSVKEDEMDVKTKVALTRVVFQTDLSVLLNEDNEWAMTPAEIMDLIGHAGRSRRATLKARIAKELKLSHKSDALSYAKELGYWIATGNTRLDDSHTNVSTIAAQYFTNPTAAEVNLLDMYSTLSALDYTDANHNAAVLKLARAEFMDNPDRNGISDLLKSHRTYKENIRADNFEENELQLVKGYIVERVDNFTSIQMGRADQAKEMKERGYSDSYPVRKVDPKQTIDTMYVTRTTPEVTDVSGVMSTTNQRNMGTTLTEILVRDPAYHFKKGPNKGKPNFYIIKATVDKFIKAKARAAKANKNFQWDDSLTMRPLRDQNGNITDYRVMMNHADVEQIIRPDLQVDHVFAHMRSSAVDRKETIESDKKTVELLVYEQLELMEASPDISWVNIMDPNSPYIDRFRKLPKAVRKHMEEYAKGGQFFVREDIIDKVFGYKSFDLSELKMLQDDDTSFKRITKRAAGLTHHAIKQTVGYGKNRVVIAMPKVVVGNMLSNIYQLMMRKIPLDYIFHKIVEGVHEYNKYRKDTERRTRLKHEIESQKLDPDTSPEAAEMRQLDDRIKGNLIHRLSKAGLNSLIVEDINDAQTDGWINKLQKSIPYSFPRAQKFIDKIPSELGDVARFLFMTKGSKPYQISRHIVQMTDFLARYVMIEHATKVKGQGFKEAVHESLDAFVVFDEAMVPALEALEAVGATSFLSYYLRNARASRKLAAQSPTGVALAAAAQHTTGIPVLGNVNSSWLAGRFTPNTLQTDDLFDEANNVSLFEIVKDVDKDLFN